MYKTQLHNLDPSGQVRSRALLRIAVADGPCPQLAVAVLAALGARATPHSVRFVFQQCSSLLTSFRATGYSRRPISFSLGWDSDSSSLPYSGTTTRKGLPSTREPSA